MDDFGWGNTRLVIGEGSSKKVIVNDDEKFEESMIPLKKFSGTCHQRCQEFLFSPLSHQSTKPRLGRQVPIIRGRLVPPDTASHDHA